MLKLAVCVLFSVPLAVSAARQAKAKPARGRDAASVIVVLTFNYNSHMKDGSVHRWNATEVYRWTAQGWRIIHTHWSLRQPKAGQP